MAPIPPMQLATLTAMQRALESGDDDWESVGVPAGDVGVECDRALWLAFRRTSAPETIDWRKRRIFERGQIEEERLLDLLRAIDCEVYGQQDRVRAAGGHLRGKIDGLVMGLPDAPKTEHIVECKSMKDSVFVEVHRHGVRKAKPEHWATFQFYLYAKGLTRVLYMASNKDTEDLHLERVEYDPDWAIRAVARIERVIQMPEPPTRLCSKRDDFRGMFCRQAAVCWGEAWPRVHCRTCLFSTPEMHGNAAWSCARWAKPLSMDEQAEGCEAHLFVPALVPGGEQIDADDDLGTVTYRMADGSVWVDGVQAVPVDVSA